MILDNQNENLKYTNGFMEYRFVLGKGKPADKFSKDNFDLIVWFVVS